MIFFSPRYLCAYSCLFWIYIATLKAQNSPEVKNVSFTTTDRIVEIHYDLINAQPEETFKVWVKAFRPDGSEISVITLNGDVGKSVKEGKNNTIFWNLDGDLESQTSFIYIQVFASSNLIRPQPFPSHLLKSVVLPGWGQSSKGKPYWIIGLGTYGVLAGSIWQNQQAEKDYKAYLTEVSLDDRSKFFEAAENKNRNSKFLAYAAGSIWIGNLIWASISKNRSKSQLSIYGVPSEGRFGITYKF